VGAIPTVVRRSSRFVAILLAGLLAPAGIAVRGAEAAPEDPPPAGGAVSDPSSGADLRALIEQNRRLQKQVDAQQRAIEALSAQVAALASASRGHADDVAVSPPSAPSRVGVAPQQPDPSQSPPVASSAESAAGSGTPVRISGLFGAGFFKTGSDGEFSNGDFRVDDAKLFVEAAVAQDIYLDAELDLITREESGTSASFGEIYATFENISGRWGLDRLLNARVGRFYIPFGEEYQVRGVMDNPLISHSLSDLWGFDQGVEIYGQSGGFSYVAAIQDGGINPLGRSGSDKAFTSRIGYDPASWLHLSASAMRTGSLNPTYDSVSALWFANGFFHSLGSPATTSSFHANLGEVDASAHWRGTQLKAAAGIVGFNDNAPKGGDARRIEYGYLEARHALSDSLYGAVRLSAIRAPGGYPLAGQGIASEYAFGNILTTRLERASFGLGYQIAPPVLLKIDYSPEWGSTSTPGENRDTEDFFATEIALRF